MKKQNDKNAFFRALKIKKSDYPPYRNLEQFTLGIRKCSLLKSHSITSSNTTVEQQARNK